MRLNDVHALARFVRARRKAQNLTQAQLADKAGVGRDWIVRLEQANPRLEVSKVLDVLDALGAVPEVDPDRPRKSPVQEEAAASDSRSDPFAEVFAGLTKPRRTIRQSSRGRS